MDLSISTPELRALHARLYRETADIYTEVEKDMNAREGLPTHLAPYRELSARITRGLAAGRARHNELRAVSAELDRRDAQVLR